MSIANRLCVAVGLAVFIAGMGGFVWIRGDEDMLYATENVDRETRNPRLAAITDEQLDIAERWAPAVLGPRSAEQARKLEAMTDAELVAVRAVRDALAPDAGWITKGIPRKTKVLDTVERGGRRAAIGSCLGGAAVGALLFGWGIIGLVRVSASPRQADPRPGPHSGSPQA